MKPILLSLAAVLVSAACFAQTPGARFYIAPNGDDTASGANPAADTAPQDGPLATLDGARAAVRRLIETKGLPQGGVEVLLRGGAYPIEAAVRFEAADAGRADAPVVYRAVPGETVILSGGRTVGGFAPVSDPGALARLAPNAAPHVLQADLRAAGITEFGTASDGTLQVYFRGQAMTLSRWPDEGFVKIAGLVEKDGHKIHGIPGSKTGKFTYAEDRPAAWAGEKDAWLHGYWFWDWSDQRQKVEAIDPEKRILSVMPPYHSYGYRIGQWFYGMNILAELDTPGEWYLDRQTGILYFWPPKPIDEGRVVVSVLDTLVTLEGVSHVTVRGLIFEAARGTAIVMRDCEHTLIAGCVLRNLGDRAVRIEGGAANGVVACDVYGTGNGGITMSGGERLSLAPGGHFADNNHLHHYGRWNRMYTPAISLDGVGNRATHNLIHDAPHMAISFGGNDHTMEFNEIHDVCLESNDAGAIYAGRDWTMRGTVIRHNYLHDITGFRGHGCVGVYLDDMFCGTQIYGNVFYRVTRAAFIGGGRDCSVENNIFVDCRPALHIDARAMGWASDSVETTMMERLKAMPYTSQLWRNRYPELVGIVQDEPAAPKGNVVVRNVSWGGRWDEVEGKARPYVTFTDNCVDTDPLFEGAPPATFRLQENSPAYRIGFKPIPVEKIGLYEDEYRTGLPGR